MTMQSKDEIRLQQLFHSTFDALQPELAAPAPAKPRRRALRPAAVAVFCLVLICGGAVGVGAAQAMRSWPSLFGGEIVETTPTDGAVFAAEQREVQLPENCAAYQEFDQPDELPTGKASSAGVYLLLDGSLYLRRAGAEDENLTDRFTGEPYCYTYTDRDTKEERTATVQGSCIVSYTRYDGSDATVTLTRVQEENGLISYLVERSFDGGGAGFLYHRTQVNSNALWALKYQVLDPEILAKPEK